MGNNNGMLALRCAAYNKEVFPVGRLHFRFMRGILIPEPTGSVSEQ